MSLLQVVCILLLQGLLLSECIHESQAYYLPSSSKKTTLRPLLLLYPKNKCSPSPNTPRCSVLQRKRTTKTTTTTTTTLSLQQSDSDEASSQNNNNNNNNKGKGNGNTAVVPTHVAFICDGNSRWAKKRGLPTSQGHVVGADRLVDLFDHLRKDGIQFCTLYGFSTENWSRPPTEIFGIFRVMEHTARKLTRQVLDENSGIHIRLLGDLEDERIPSALRKILQMLQRASANKQKRQSSNSDKDGNSLTVCLAINYGGRQDILQASQKMANALAKKEITEDQMTEERLASYLSTAGIPDPDLIIRTSGEFRLSNFLLWNCAYSELYMTPVLWPDFDGKCWRDSLEWYQQRQRRFGARTNTEIGMEEEQPRIATATATTATTRQYNNNHLSPPQKNGKASA